MPLAPLHRIRGLCAHPPASYPQREKQTQGVSKDWSCPDAPSPSPFLRQVRRARRPPPSAPAAAARPREVSFFLKHARRIESTLGTACFYFGEEMDMETLTSD
jgi:hypothetical protein